MANVRRPSTDGVMPHAGEHGENQARGALSEIFGQSSVRDGYAESEENRGLVTRALGDDF